MLQKKRKVFTQTPSLRRWDFNLCGVFLVESASSRACSSSPVFLASTGINWCICLSCFTYNHTVSSTIFCVHWHISVHNRRGTCLHISNTKHVITGVVITFTIVKIRYGWSLVVVINSGDSETWMFQREIELSKLHLDAVSFKHWGMAQPWGSWIPLFWGTKMVKIGECWIFK